MNKKKPIINITTGVKDCALGCIKISFGFVNKKLIVLFIKKFFNKNLLKNKFVIKSNLYDLKGQLLDKTVIIYFKKPKTHTGDDILEIYCHGNKSLLDDLISNFCIYLRSYNVKISKKGEFTKRAYLNNKLNILEINNIFNIYNNYKKNYYFNVVKYRNKIIKVVNFIKNIIEINKKVININKLNNILNNIFYLKNIIFSIIKNYKFKKNNNSSIIIFGYVNVGKSTFVNNFVKNLFSITNFQKNTTKILLEKKIRLCGMIFKISDTPGFFDNYDSVDYLNFMKAIKIIIFYRFIVYIRINNVMYDIFFYYINNIIKKFQVVFKITNKSDKFKSLIFFELNLIGNLKKINFNISSIFRLGFNFILNEIKRNFYNVLKHYKNFFLKILEKSYKKIHKCILLFYKKEYAFMINETKKIVKLLNVFLQIKNKYFLNKLLKKFCTGK